MKKAAATHTRESRPVQARWVKKGSGAKVTRKASIDGESTRAGGNGELRVRMYRVGFGDFFLVTIPSNDGPQHILIDCGVTNGRTGKGDIGTIKAAVADMARETKSKLALIIVTHRHMDHIIGFSRCGEVFKEFKVEAIWMPYWETEYDAQIANFQSELTSLAVDVQSHLALAAGDTTAGDEMLAMLENATGNVLGVAGTGGGTNAQSLALLKHGLGVQPKYYCKGDTAELPKALVDAGLTAEILGPPPKDATVFMRLKDLKKGVGQYLQAAEGGDDSKIFRPFSESCKGAASDYPASAFREWAPRAPNVAPDFSKSYSASLEKAVQAAQPSVLLTAVKKLDDFLNNQSLVVLFTYRGKKLLFAGDAQAGNWEYWLYDGAKPTTTPGDKLGNEGANVLGELAFYKVGHHGSTNATPIVAVENINPGFAAMCSTQENSFGSVANNSEVPRQPLIQALRKKGSVVCSNDVPVKLDNVEVPAAVDSAPLPKPETGKFQVGDCFVDYLF
jgi:beta-lactamase superfamily II metal-dependent hydrolase